MLYIYQDLIRNVPATELGCFWVLETNLNPLGLFYRALASHSMKLYP